MIRDANRVARRARNLRFHRIVQRVVDDLPDTIQELLEGVAIVVEDEPSAEQRRESGLRDHESLFGLYQGIPRTARTSGYSLVAPDRITIFAGVLERACGSRRELEEQIRTTVLHELGHHLGYDEAGLERLGLA